MLKYYYVIWNCYLDGVLMDSSIVDAIAEKPPDDIFEFHNWYKLHDFYLANKNKLPFCMVFRGRDGGFIYWKNDKVTKEKKYHNMNMTIKLTAELHTPTLKDLYRYEDGVLARQYLLERNDNIIIPN